MKQRVLAGVIEQPDVELVPTAPDDLRDLHFQDAEARALTIDLTMAHLRVAGSSFDDCRFTQRSRPVLNAHGVAAQGAFGHGAAPSIYRGCRFERVRLKLLGGFSLGRARFEDCEFVNCKWDGHFAHRADLIGCRFVGRMNGCVWFGEDDPGDGTPPRVNQIVDNDFTATEFTNNVAWRFNFPRHRQRFPADYVPIVDDLD